MATRHSPVSSLARGGWAGLAGHVCVRAQPLTVVGGAAAGAGAHPAAGGPARVAVRPAERAAAGAAAGTEAGTPATRAAVKRATGTAAYIPTGTSLPRRG